MHAICRALASRQAHAELELLHMVSEGKGTEPLTAARGCCHAHHFDMSWQMFNTARPKLWLLNWHAGGEGRPCVCSCKFMICGGPISATWLGLGQVLTVLTHVARAIAKEVDGDLVSALVAHCILQCQGDKVLIKATQADYSAPHQSGKYCHSTGTGQDCSRWCPEQTDLGFAAETRLVFHTRC